MSAARVAVRFSRDDSVSGLDHRETMTLWGEALRTAALPVEVTEGRSPRPRFALAAPLPPHYTSEAEWLEVHLLRSVTPGEIVAALNDCLPAGFRILEARLMSDAEPSLQSQVKFAEYRMLVEPGTSPDDLGAAIDSFFATPSRPWEEALEGRSRRFDLRDLVDDLWIEQSEGGYALGMRLDASSNGTGRPDSVLAGLGFENVRGRHRTRLLLAHMPGALRLWRRQGRFEDRPER